MRVRRASSGEPAAAALAQLRRDFKRWTSRADADSADWERACSDFLRHASALAAAHAASTGAPILPSLVLAPASFVRVVYLIRHAEAAHNVGDAGAVDPPLTAKGRRAAAALRRLRVDAVVSSPQRRALETAAIAFDDGGGPAAAAWWRPGRGPRAPSPRLLAHALLRESHLGLPSDEVAPGTAARFPRFERVASAAGVAASAAARAHTPATPEPAAVAAARASAFLAWLATQRHARVAVVSHGGLLGLLLSSFGHDLGPAAVPAFRAPFALGEARAFAVTDLHGCVSVEVAGGE